VPVFLPLLLLLLLPRPLLLLLLVLRLRADRSGIVAKWQRHVGFSYSRAGKEAK
jgi:hypothetical protein